MWRPHDVESGLRLPAAQAGKAVKRQPAAASAFALCRALLLPLLLLFVQQGAFLHALSHYQPAQSQKEDHQQKADAACELCLVFAQLDTAPTPQTQPMQACQFGFSVPSTVNSLTWTAPAPPEQSRGPPSFL